MKKFRRIALLLGAGLMGLVAAAWLLSLDGVDHLPYLREPYYQETTARLRASVATNSILRGELSAGFGRALLTPAINARQDDPEKGQFRSLPLAGYGGRHGKAATGVHDDLYVKAVALRVGDRVGVKVGADGSTIPTEVTDATMRRLEQESRFSRGRVCLGASHTHVPYQALQPIVVPPFQLPHRPRAGFAHVPWPMLLAPLRLVLQLHASPASGCPSGVSGRTPA